MLLNLRFNCFGLNVVTWLIPLNFDHFILIPQSWDWGADLSIIFAEWNQTPRWHHCIDHEVLSKYYWSSDSKPPARFFLSEHSFGSSESCSASTPAPVFAPNFAAAWVGCQCSVGAATAGFMTISMRNLSLLSFSGMSLALSCRSIRRHSSPSDALLLCLLSTQRHQIQTRPTHLRASSPIGSFWGFCSIAWSFCFCAEWWGGSTFEQDLICSLLTAEITERR